MDYVMWLKPPSAMVPQMARKRRRRRSLGALMCGTSPLALAPRLL